jgi:hypothetical protein
MEKEFIPYEQALALKELGFDEEQCLGWYESFYSSGTPHLQTEWSEEYLDFDILVPAPLFSQVFRFFREKYGYDYSIKPVYGEKHYRYYRVNIYVNEKLIQVMKYYFPYNPYFDNREEAELEALKKLIEIVKNK